MSKKANKNTATAQNGKSVQTEAVPMQPQQPIAPNGNSSETASGVAGVEATTTNPQSIDAAEQMTESQRWQERLKAAATGKELMIVLLENFEVSEQAGIILLS